MTTSRQRGLQNLLKDNLLFWEISRLKGVSASMADMSGNCDPDILSAFDEVARKAREHKND